MCWTGMRRFILQFWVVFVNDWSLRRYPIIKSALMVIRKLKCMYAWTFFQNKTLKGVTKHLLDFWAKYISPNSLTNCCLQSNSLRQPFRPRRWCIQLQQSPFKTQPLQTEVDETASGSNRCECHGSCPRRWPL